MEKKMESKPEKTKKFVKDIMFAYSWHIDKQDPSTTTIRVYGLDKKNRNTVLIVDDFKPYVYLQLPDDIEWSYSRMNKLTTRLTELLREHTPYSYEFQQKKRLYYANLDERGNRKLFPYLKCVCSCANDIKALSNKCRRPIKIDGIDIHMKIHENNANPILQLTSQRLLPTAGWIEFTGRRIVKDLQTTWCHSEYKVSWTDLSPYKLDTVARPLLMGFDIEVNSSIPSSMPKAFRPNDQVFQISCVLARQGSLKTTEEKYLFTLGETNEIDGVEVRMYENEGDLLIGFTDFIQEKQPNVLIGYNILGFDIPYMVARAKEPTGFTITDFDQQSMLKGHHAKEEVKSWSSSAYKNQNFTYLDVEGRIFVDLLPLIKRDHRLSDYKLKTVASHFLQGITKDPLDAQGIFECYRLGMKGGESGKKALTLCGTYCVKDSELVVRLFEVLTTWFALCEMSKVTGVPIFSLYTQGQQLRVFSQIYRKATHENIVVEREAYVIKPDDYYVGATVVTPVPGVYDNVAPEDFSSMYPSLIIAYNMCFSTLVNDESIPLELTHVHEWEDHTNCDHDPNIIRKKEVISKIKEGEDEMKKLRQERDLKINKQRKDEFNSKINEIKIKLKPYRDERTQLNKSKGRQMICAKRRYRWLKTPKGVLPEILENLLDTRAKTKKEMEKIKKKLETMKDTDPEYYDLSVYLDILDQRQYALKISCNSGYGATGARKGYLTCMPVAMCTTYMGRCSIEMAYKTIVSKYNGTLVYGDTDSNYISFPHLKTPQEIWDYASYVAQEVTKLFPPPMALAFEKKIYSRFLILTKKRYMSITTDREGKCKLNKETGKPEISKKGVLLTRRDNCQFIRKVYESVIMAIFDKKPIDEILFNIIEEINKLCSGYYSIDNFIVSKSVGEVGLLEPKEVEDEEAGKMVYKIGDYKLRKILPSDPSERSKELARTGAENEHEYYLHVLPAQAQLAEKMRERGQLVAAGSRLQYVITTTGGHTAKQYLKIEDAEYFSRHSSALKLDYLYYLKQLSNPLDQVLDVIYGGSKIGDRPYRKGFVTEQYKFRQKVREAVLNDLRGHFSPRFVIVED